MKSIKLFKYNDTNELWVFLAAYGYKLDDVKGFSFAGKRQCCGNVFKLYRISFQDGEYEYFKVISFKDFHEYRQARLGFGRNKLISWFESADLSECK